MYEHFFKYFLPHYWKQDEPDSMQPTPYHPEFGFEDRLHERKAIVTSATEEDMNAVGMEQLHRDECVYYKIRYRGCLHHNAPFFLKCDGIRKEISQCKKQQLTYAMKEFERERRLNRRERLLAEMAAK